MERIEDYVPVTVVAVHPTFDDVAAGGKPILDRAPDVHPLSGAHPVRSPLGNLKSATESEHVDAIRVGDNETGTLDPACHVLPRTGHGM